MQKTITTLIPQYGELNRICKDWIVSHTFSFEKQKFIVDFYSKWSDIKAFEQAILELVLHTPPEPCTLLLKSLKKEVKEYIRLYESYRLLHDEVIIRVCYQYADRYKETIKEEMEVVNRLRKPMNEANNRYDSIGYREHTPEEEKLAEREYERCKAEYEREKAQLEHLYEQQTLLWKEARQYMKNRCDDIYLLSVHFMGILVYPDFTFLSRKTGEEIYWEHEGMMDKSDYAKTAVKKLESYQKNGIYLGERLIATFETEQTLLNSQIIEQLVKKYLL